jgi:hypothetical protein
MAVPHTERLAVKRDFHLTFPTRVGSSYFDGTDHQFVASPRPDRQQGLLDHGTEACQCADSVRSDMILGISGSGDSETFLIIKSRKTRPGSLSLDPEPRQLNASAERGWCKKR